MQKRKVSCTFKRENLSTLETQERIYLLVPTTIGCTSRATCSACSSSATSRS